MRNLPALFLCGPKVILMKAYFADKTLVKEFFKYVSLSVLAMVALSFYILADTFFISQGLGTYGLAALNLAVPVYYFMHGVALMLAMGGATRYSVYVSRGQRKEADIVFTTTAILAATFSLIFFLTGALFSGELATLLGADENTYAMTEIYIKVLLLFSPAFIFNDLLVCFIRNDGAPRVSMIATVTGSLANVLLDYIFIFPCKMGMFGAILATGLAPAIGICVMSAYFIRRRNNFRFIKSKLSAKTVLSIFTLGIPSLVEQFSTAVVILVFNYIILGTDGSTAVAAYGVIANIALVVISVFTGIAQGVQPLLSREHGRGGNGGGTCYSLALITAAVISAIIYAAVFIFAVPISDIFNREHDPQLTQIASEGMKIYFAAIFFTGFNIITCMYFTATEKVVPAHIISLLRGLIVIIPAALIFSRFFGLTGVWISYPVTEAVVAVAAALIFALLLKRSKKAEIKSNSGQNN